FDPAREQLCSRLHASARIGRSYCTSSVITRSFLSRRPNLNYLNLPKCDSSANAGMVDNLLREVRPSPGGLGDAILGGLPDCAAYSVLRRTYSAQAFLRSLPSLRTSVARCCMRSYSGTASWRGWPRLENGDANFEDHCGNSGSHSSCGKRPKAPTKLRSA